MHTHLFLSSQVCSFFYHHHRHHQNTKAIITLTLTLTLTLTISIHHGQGQGQGEERRQSHHQKGFVRASEEYKEEAISLPATETGRSRRRQETKSSQTSSTCRTTDSISESNVLFVSRCCNSILSTHHFHQRRLSSRNTTAARITHDRWNHDDMPLERTILWNPGGLCHRVSPSTLDV